jgi:hypothetical protein
MKWRSYTEFAYNGNDEFMVFIPAMLDEIKQIRKEMRMNIKKKPKKPKY